MTFREIFKKDGMYIADGFKSGFAFVIQNGILFCKFHKSINDYLAEAERYPMNANLFDKEYKKVNHLKEIFYE